MANSNKSHSPTQAPVAAVDFKSLRNPYEDQIEHRELAIGPYRVRPLPTTQFGLDGGAMFGTVPKVLWEKAIPADERNRIPMQARALLLDGGPGQPRIMIDCGIGGDFIAKYGEKLGPKFAEMYAVASGESAIENALKAVGLGVEDITHVILTHLHFDHCGGATTERNGKLVPTFPRAKYFVQKANLETARHPNLREKASYYAANFEPLLTAGVLTVVDGAVSDLIPATSPSSGAKISVEVTNGHTTGQQVVKVSDGASTLLYCGDLVPTSAHVRLPWVMGYDLNPLLIIEEKREILSVAAREGWYLFFEHDPFIDAATVEEAKDDFSVKTRLTLR